MILVEFENYAISGGLLSPDKESYELKRVCDRKTLFLSYFNDPHESIMNKPLADFPKEKLKLALQWAEQGATFDHIEQDVPEAARAWVSERLELVEKMFKAQIEFSGQWLRGEIGLSDIEQPFRETFTGWIHETIRPRKNYYERHKDTGATDNYITPIKVSKEACREAFEFLAIGERFDYIQDLPSALRNDVHHCAGLEVSTRHLEKKQRDARWIARGIDHMSKTEKNIDAECIESVQAGLDDFIRSLKERLEEPWMQEAMDILDQS